MQERYGMKQIKIAAVIIIVLSFIISLSLRLIDTAKNVNRDVRENYLISEHMYDTIQQEFGTIITISNTMAANHLLHDALKQEDALSESEMENIMKTYLRTIRERFNYKAAYVISEKTHRYYTPNGIDKIVNPTSDPYDIWYTLFLDSGKAYDLDTDRDQANDYRWTVFINVRIVDENGNFLGVTGVGVFMDTLQTMLEQFETTYKFKVNLVDLDGLIQVDTNSSNIENAYISDILKDKATKDAFTYTKRGLKGFRMTRFMEALDWYLVVQGTNSLSNSYIGIILTYIFICALLLFAYYLVVRHSGKQEERVISRTSSEDALTGLPNRNYFKEAYGELGILNTTRYKSIAIFDIDKFKSINETRDGDKIIRDITALSQTSIAGRGLFFRWGGDEFVVLLELTAEDAVEMFTKLCKAIEQNVEVTISVGVSKINLSDRIKTNYYRAAQMCYVVKESGGNGVRNSE